ncbi:hypothetical protein [Psychrobacter sp. PAMC 21119]|uniref:hypothetical protein n=1 Tax=Psychrobacter sp. PAMC 21119 TaxID=1112209 RepID=UPI00028879BA|nr:hypothetical protein [Psychrobacter sp. PAMC 21119]
MSKDRSIHALNGHLHDQLERLLNPDISEENLELEVKRSKAITTVASQIIDGERVVNQRAKLIAEHDPNLLAQYLMPKGVTYESG